jgi:hypothetical protein
MPNRLVVAALAALALAGCAGQRQTRRQVYLNIMTPLQRAEYAALEQEYQPASLRLAYLQKIGVYQKWAEQPIEVQDAILRRDVRPGMTPLQVRMALGEPDRTEDATLPEDRAAGQGRVVWYYGISGQRSAPGGYQRAICFLGDQVLWVRTS